MTFTGVFQPKYGPLGWFLGRIVMEPRFETQLDAVLDGLASYTRTDDASEVGEAPAT